VLARFAGVSDPVLLPEDRPAVDAALAGGRLLAEAAPASAYRAAVIAMAAQLLGVQDPSARRRRRRRTVAAGR
jgi:Flp pilus assembly CpaE family ATPase